MLPLPLAPSAALVGGLLWVIEAILGGGSDPLAQTLHLVGLLLLMLAAGLFGSSLVRSNAVAMHGVVGFCSALLLLAMIESFRLTASPWYDGTWGALFALVGAVALLRARTRASGDAGPVSH